ncbi:MAG: hypothetical protein JJ975_08470 [Bacteroidia bacterium]|nr:hypothetical protein [Bacteroidia bacterium]
MKKLFLTILTSLFVPIALFAQVSLFTQPTNSFGFRSEDVWSMTVSITNDKPIRGYFDAVITSNTKEVVRLTSEAVTLEPGVTQFTRSTLWTTSKKYLHNDAQEYETLTGELPPGNYRYCVQFICLDEQCAKSVGLEKTIKVCESITKETTTPLLLFSPEDEAELATKRPDFRWIAPMPIGANPEISYRIKLVKLTEEQSAEDGIQRNRPIYSGSGLKGTSMAFPPELDDLELEQRYGWQVEAWLGASFVARSESWEFKIVEETEEIQGMPYVRLKKGDASIYHAVNELRFIFDEPLARSKLNIRFIDESGKDVTPDNVLFPTKFGENQFAIDIARLDLLPGRHYTAVITSATGEKFRLRFQYIFEFKD